jgi:hypothetical protein
MAILPKIKSTITSFLVSEEGKISKQGILGVGAFLVGTIALSPIAFGCCNGCAASGGCACCGCGGCGVGGCGGISWPTPTHSSSSEVMFNSDIQAEQTSHYSHSSIT